MYQIRVRWNPESEFQSYEFHTKNEAHAFQLALKEMILVTKSPLIYEFNPTSPHFGFTLAAALLVSVWAVIWWHLGAMVFPNAAMTYTDIQIAICSGLAYIMARIISKWFDA